MKTLATLSLLACVVLSGCVVVPVGPPRVAYAPAPIVVVPHAYYYGHGYWR
jgi:hypothetical protein